jgi:hypothetical protein
MDPLPPKPLMPPPAVVKTSPATPVPTKPMVPTSIPVSGSKAPDDQDDPNEPLPYAGVGSLPKTPREDSPIATPGHDVVYKNMGGEIVHDRYHAGITPEPPVEVEEIDEDEKVSAKKLADDKADKKLADDKADKKLADDKADKKLADDKKLAEKKPD